MFFGPRIITENLVFAIDPASHAVTYMNDIVNNTAVTTAGSPGFSTPYAFGKAPISTYTKMGYKPVNRKALRKKAKGTDYIDLYKD